MTQSGYRFILKRVIFLLTVLLAIYLIGCTQNESDSFDALQSYSTSLIESLSSFDGIEFVVVSHNFYNHTCNMIISATQKTKEHLLEEYFVPSKVNLMATSKEVDHAIQSIFSSLVLVDIVKYDENTLATPGGVRSVFPVEIYMYHEDFDETLFFAMNKEKMRICIESENQKVFLIFSIDQSSATTLYDYVVN